MSKFSGIRDPGLELRPATGEPLDLSQHRVAVVGGTSGLGRALALFMAENGADVLVVGRTFRDQGTRGLSFERADLESMVEARRIGRAMPAEDLDLLVLTNGIMSAPEREQTAEGLERDLAVSFLSRLAIVREAAPRLGMRSKTSRAPRMFVMGFPGTGEAGDLEDFNAERNYKAFTAHMNTVAGNEALVLDAARRYSHLHAYGLNPGLVKTDIRGNYLGAGSLKHRIAEWLIGLFMSSAEQYAHRIGPLLFAPELDGRTGVHINAKGAAILPSAVMTPERVTKLIEVSEALLERAVASGLGNPESAARS